MQGLLVPAPAPQPSFYRQVLVHWPLFACVIGIVAFLLWPEESSLGLVSGLTLLLGKAEEGTSVNKAIGSATEKAEAFRYECIATGTVTVVKYHTGETASSNEKTVATIFNDSSGGKVPGTLATGTAEIEAVGKPATNAVNTIEGFSVAVTKGTFYWIAIQSVGTGTIKVKLGSTVASAKGKVASKKPSEVAEWKEEVTGPWYLIAEGTVTEGGATITLQAASSTSGASAEVQAPTAIPLTAASSTSSAVGQVSTGYLPIEPASSVSNASATVVAPTAIPLSPASSTSAAQAEVTTGATTENIYYGPTVEEASENAKTALQLEEAGVRKGDIYKSAIANSPIVIMVHGGGFYGGARTERNAQAKNLQAAGVTVFNIDYLLDEAVKEKIVGEAKRKGFPLEIESVEEAVRWIINHAASYNGDTTRVFLVGGSAGGYLVHAAAINLNAAKAGTVLGVISLSGIGQLVKIIEDDVNSVEKVPGIWGKDTRKALNNAPRELPKGAVLEEAELYSWTKHITGANAASKSLIFNSEGEETTPKDQPLLMKEAYEAAGKRVFYEEVPGTAHSFSYWSTVLASGKTVEKAIIAFIFEPLITLQAASSTSAAGAIVTSGGVNIQLQSAISSSSSKGQLTAPTAIPLQAASSTSTAAPVPIITTTIIPLRAASATSSAEAVLTVPIVIPLRIVYAAAEGSTIIPSDIVSNTQIPSDMEVI